ncbi:C40 family peptidase [Curtobacterium sp. VKM Ac-2865]|uniref:C40 family peptidase n=1 Tax=Curtobacterium sp. VKM Ac-2865 TaxID=2783817 RepID=UPI00188B8179|nr:C40 family peptidase [Curtobacterium sp. VKM Ac-2865]MBF4584413.1 C40 family peptidase [Curtobacterium sp. VKM Ac-2865]
MTQTGSAADDMSTNPTNTVPTNAGLPNTGHLDATDAPLTRRAARAAETPTRRRAVTPVRSAPLVRPTAVAASTQAKPTASSRKRKFMAPVVLAVAAGMFGTMAVPAAFAATQQTGASDAAAAQQAVRTTESQQLTVSDAAVLADTSRDGFSATSTATLESRKHAADVEAARAAAAKQYASYTGPTATDYLASSKTSTAAGTTAAAAAVPAAAAPAANTPFSLPAVVATAKQYIGTPYVFGGATPAGFDCSGYVMFVYAQYGINLAHSVPLQDAAGTTIPTSEAQPGDVVIFNSEAHDGFYMGNGMIMDAPKPGGAVSIRPIWTSEYHIVRFGV